MLTILLLVLLVSSTFEAATEQVDIKTLGGGLPRQRRDNDILTISKREVGGHSYLDFLKATATTTARFVREMKFARAAPAWFA